jgi:hypothetical protein
MSFLERVIQRLGPRRMDDPRFGRITFQDVPRHPERSYWEAESSFAPAKGSIEFCVTAGGEGPSQLQRDFVTALESRWPSIETRVTEFLHSRGMTRFPRDFRLTLISIPRLPTEPVEWEITFDERESGDLLELEMRGDEPQRFDYEGSDH